MNKNIMMLLTCTIAFTLIFFIFIQKSNAESNTPEVDIATSPDSVLFDLSNLKPGDWAERTITIENNGTENFKYLTQGSLKQGSEKFYNEIFLKISNDNKVLFEGKMKDFNKLQPRLLEKNKSELLYFKIVVPEELGNDFQGLSCEVQFKFYVEGTLGGLIPVDGPKLPETGTNMFNLLISGAALIFVGGIFQLYLSVRRRLVK